MFGCCTCTSSVFSRFVTKPWSRRKPFESFARKTEIADSVYKVAILKKSLNLIGPSGQHYGATYESRQSLKCI